MTLQINNVDYAVVVDNSKNIIVEAGKICLQHIKEGTCVFVDITPEILDLFSLEYPVAEDLQEPEARDVDTNSNKKWCRNGTLLLINLFKTFQPKFQSATIKNDRVWDQIANELCANKFNFSSSQCKERWKYLKSRYMKRIDNMKQTGEERVKFDFFNEMDAILGKQPNVSPIAIASSSRDVHDPEEHTNDALVENKKKKRKQDNDTEALSILKEMRQVSLQREENRERRHKEMMAIREKAVQSYNDKMEALLKKL